MKRLLNKAIILAMLAVTWVGCSQDDAIVDYTPTSAQESESNIQISLNLNIPDPIQASSRNGITEKIENITVLCFDKDGLALKNGKQVATLTPTGNESGSLKVTIPNATRILHLFANQTEIPFVIGNSEADLVGLAATDNKMVYWGRIEVPSNVTSSADAKAWWADAKTVVLLRNMAKVEVENNSNGEFEFQGFTVVSTKASGTAVAYDAENGAYATNDLGSESPMQAWIDADYIHASTAEATVSGTDATMQTEGAVYIYETPAMVPASIIIKGKNQDAETKYWKVAFVGSDGQQLDIRRNHLYTVKIEGALMGGDESFEAALASTSTANNAWLMISDEVTAVKNKDFSMTVENTSYVMMDGTESLSFNFYIEQLGDKAFTTSDLSVTWENGQDVSADDEVNLTPTVTGKLYKATVTVSLKALAEGVERQEGTIVIKYGSKLQRKVKVIVIPEQQFEIVSYNEKAECTVDADGNLVYSVSIDRDDYENEDYTIDGAPIDKLKFKVPGSFPTQLLPFNVLVSTTDFNVVNSTLIFEGDGGYGEDNGIGYKYVYQVSATETEYEIPLRYINNVLTDKVEVTLEAAYFQKVKLIVNYTVNAEE